MRSRQKPQVEEETEALLKSMCCAKRVAGSNQALSETVVVSLGKTFHLVRKSEWKLGGGPRGRRHRLSAPGQLWLHT